MATARDFFKFMRECTRAGQVVQLQSTADGKYSMGIYQSHTPLTGHLSCGWSATEGCNYTAKEASSHCSRIKSLKMLRR